MSDAGARGKQAAATATASAVDPVVKVVREILSGIPAGCSWLLPVTSDGQVVDFRIEATSGRGPDICGRGVSRVGGRLSELYPSMVGGPLWQLYHQVMFTGQPGQLPDFRYEEKRAGVIAESLFDVSVHRVLGGLLVCWQRLDEDQRRMDKAELLGSLGWAEYDLTTGRSQWSPGMYRIFARDPALGPLSRAEQAAALFPEDFGLREAAWQTLDSGATSDVTVRFRAGTSVKYLRILSDTARDADGAPLKIYAVVQDVTARVDSRTAIEQLSDQLHTREMTALAEHRLAGQLQNLIQPVPREPFPLAGLEAMVSYLPAESAVRVGGDWYHAQTLPDGQVALAVGDVAGHGLEAASGMAHLRFALVAWLSIGIRDPGTLLGHLNHLCRQLAITGTAVIARYDPTTRLLSWTRAGHMAPLLARAGTTAALDRPSGLLLGADDGARYPVVSPRLEVDDLVLLYTDGLVERRSGGADDLLGRVRRALSDLSALPGDEMLVRLPGLLHYASPDDDTCTLAVRVLP
ncbi:PP2C family protein-serine/threonine phosphatase [Micromonospora sp. ATA51]|uniref:PP2C family protein-serine/threonine phosphatase n=1 Tax=Micromonospora sp. ATA51 TaxID=2806098 RepID=UPI001A5F7915|nr:PP2C family protein-serine/threonine phosphatase [Micromonospora sp. ATA51]MBM0226206.1 SpoIIE family protein phosphatase [Micromonospora sp. ATA51]